MLPSRLCRDLGGFLLLTATSAVHFTGDPGISRPSYVDGTDQVGIPLALRKSDPFVLVKSYPGALHPFAQGKKQIIYHLHRRCAGSLVSSHSESVTSPL